MNKLEANDRPEMTSPACGVGAEGFKCAVVSWVMPLIAVIVLIAGLRFPVLSVFNIVFLAFGLLALVRSIAHIRIYGSCGLGTHVAIGTVLNVAIVILAFVYIFTGFDPLHLRP